VGALLVVLGSAAGAVIPWLVIREGTSAATGFALNGLVCGLLGALASASRGTSTPAIDVALGFLGTAAPLTLCLAGLPGVGSSTQISALVRRFAATFALALVSGTCCATVGFVLVESVRQISVKEDGGESLSYLLMTSSTTPRSGNATLWLR
jgi:hypothetical protein